MTKPKEVQILVFDDAEVLDFCGPYEVFSVTAQFMDPKPFKVSLVGNKPGPIRAINGLSVNTEFTTDNAPQADILLIPGGLGTRPLLNDEKLLGWIKERGAKCEYLLSVCTGALMLAKAGLLDGLEATTHHLALPLLHELAPKTKIHENRRVVDNGKIVCSAGVAAGIDMSFHVVARILGKERAIQTSKYMEYEWREAGRPTAAVS